MHIRQNFHVLFYNLRGFYSQNKRVNRNTLPDIKNRLSVYDSALIKDKKRLQFHPKKIEMQSFLVHPFTYPIAHNTDIDSIYNVVPTAISPLPNNPKEMPLSSPSSVNLLKSYSTVAYSPTE